MAAQKTTTTIHRAHKIALSPTPAQAAALAQNCGFARRAYNDAIARFKAGIDQTPPQWLGLKELSAAHTQDKYLPGNEWMQDCIARAGSNSVKNAAGSIKQWGTYRKSLKSGKPGRFAGFPKFHSRSGRWSFAITRGEPFTQYTSTHIRIPKIGAIRMRQSLRFNGRVHTVTISRDGNRWFASFAVDTQIPMPQPGMKEGPTIAAHPSVRTLLTESTSATTIKVPPPKPLDAALRKLRRLDKAIDRSRNTHGKNQSSKRRERMYAQRRKLYARVSNIRHDAQHKASRALVDRAGTVRLEQWDSAGLLEKRDAGVPRRVHHRKHRDFADAAPASLVHKITYKAEWVGVRVERFARAYPSSIKCSACGWINDPTPAAVFRCVKCGHVEDREENATTNMLHDSP